MTSEIFDIDSFEVVEAPLGWQKYYREGERFEHEIEKFFEDNPDYVHPDEVERSRTPIDDAIKLADQRLMEPLIELQATAEYLQACLDALILDKKAANRRRRITFLMCLLFAEVAWITIFHPSMRVVRKAAIETQEKVISAIDSIAPDLTKSPKKGDKIDRFTVTSPFGYRGNIGIKGASTWHRGVDLDMQIGEPVYAIARPGETVTVKCWTDKGGGGLVASFKTPWGVPIDYLHLSECFSGVHKAGAIVAKSGNTGIGAPHLHFQQRDPKTLEKIPPEKFYILWGVTGRQPKPFISKQPKGFLEYEKNPTKRNDNKNQDNAQSQQQTNEQKSDQNNRDNRNNNNDKKQVSQ